MSDNDTRALGLKSSYTFEDLIIGANNHIAAKACLEVVKAPGEAYNPLYIYGPSGVGKTHMMQAVAFAMLKANGKLKVKYISAERFANETIVAISEDKILDLRRRYGELDLFLLDDAQFLIESKSAQAEFFHIFNNLHQANRQIILTADQAPNNMKGLDKNILTRLEWGLATDLKLPDVKTRVEILEIKQKKAGLKLSPEMIRYAAGMLRSNVRELEGFLKKINAYLTLSYQEINMDLIKTIIREILPEEQADLSPEEVPAETGKVAPGVAKPPAKQKKEETQQVVQELRVQNGANPSMREPIATPKPLEVVLPEKPASKAREIVPPSSSIISEENDSPVVEPPQEIGSSQIDVDISEDEDQLPSGYKEVKAVFFFPDGCQEALEAVAKKFQEVIKKHKLKFRLKRAADESYQIKGKINYTTFVDLCKKHKVPVAIVIGPPPTAMVSEQDFYDLLSVTLDVQGVSLQLVNWGEINKDYRYLNLSLDIALVRTR